MKKIFVVFLALVTVLSLIACDRNKIGTDEDVANIEDGTYKGTGNGKGGEISVEVNIKDDTIEGIKVLEQSETPGYEVAMEILTEKILETNDIEVDAVSGSTLTSTGFLEAVNNALEAAGATPDMLKDIEKVADGEKEDISEEHEIVIIGAGGAGLVAAIEAKSAGADVVILEKMPLAGGNTLISGAEYAAPANWIQKREGIEDSPELMIQDMLKSGENINNEELVTVVAENALKDAKWLRDEIGVVWEDELMFFGGHSVKRSLIPLGASGREIITKELSKAEEMDIPIFYSTEATNLITDEKGKVVGVKAQGKDKNYTFNATKAVIIASGGFGSNIEMREKYNPKIDETILSTNTVGSTGDGIVMAEDIGASLVGMEYIQTYPICDPLTGTLLYVDDARLYGYTIIVNKEGKRFVEELDRRDVISLAIKEQTGNVCYELFDQKAFDESKLQENHPQEIEYLYDNELLVKADTLEEAANFFQINVDTFKETVDKYNSYVQDGKDLEFNKRSLPSTIETAPFYILKAAPAVHHTMGGIQINSNAEVLDSEGNIIKGLFAAGEVSGGIHGANRLGSNALADITVFGRIAGRNASK